MRQHCSAQWQAVAAISNCTVLLHSLLVLTSQRPYRDVQREQALAEKRNPQPPRVVALLPLSQVSFPACLMKSMQKPSLPVSESLDEPQVACADVMYAMSKPSQRSAC